MDRKDLKADLADLLAEDVRGELILETEHYVDDTAPAPWQEVQATVAREMLKARMRERFDELARLTLGDWGFTVPEKIETRATKRVKAAVKAARQRHGRAPKVLRIPNPLKTWASEVYERGKDDPIIRVWLYLTLKRYADRDKVAYLGTTTYRDARDRREDEDQGAVDAPELRALSSYERRRGSRAPILAGRLKSGKPVYRTVVQCRPPRAVWPDGRPMKLSKNVRKAMEARFQELEREAKERRKRLLTEVA